ncbi:hypothetical protein [Burkholderia multivorans]|uniref:hypothetical protein n=1 Tax=Burkholderia multivorans TaxID=87883 RepID=UPI000CFFEC80|nr:hypothetical protein [Burkholderia multivorans]MBN6738811.1 hypothetical protein [Burkholderia multivorans]MBN7130214.1 hypothetical protein [Burkholderia multivorans]MBN8173390.1 hypothetical protein [Burkholderia multivorans]MBU9575903.1 hypothetical protein [Burkholderia multivorans]MDN7865463.1 hypothetical protein [Burkholderia multivorans]
MDSFCKKITTPDGTVLSGAAAREYRLSLYDDGVDEVIANVHAETDARNARRHAQYVIEKAAASTKRINRTRTGEKVN